jgi:hypothetical protein
MDVYGTLCATLPYVDDHVVNILGAMLPLLVFNIQRFSAPLNSMFSVWRRRTVAHTHTHTFSVERG